MRLEQNRINISQLAVTAKQVSKEIGTFISDKNINSNNLVVLVGEYHTQLSHHYFERKLIQNLHNQIGLEHLFVEGYITWQDEVQKGAARNSYSRTFEAAFKRDNIHSYVHNIPMHYAFRKQIPVHLIDAEDEYDDDDEDYYVGNVLPANMKEKYRHNKVVKKLLKKSGDELFRENFVHHISSRQGILKRDLFMMDNILDITAQKPGLSLGIVGEFHVANTQDPNQPSLSEMLLASGKDVLNIVLRPGENACGKGEKYSYKTGFKKAAIATSMQAKRVAEHEGPNIFNSMNIEISGRVSDNWFGLATLYAKNRDMPSLGIPVLAAVEKLAEVKKDLSKVQLRLF